MFAHDLCVLQIVVLGDLLIEALDLIGRHQLDRQMDENLLFIGRGLAKARKFFLFHSRQRKKMRSDCPAKSFNPFRASNLSLRKNAP